MRMGRTLATCLALTSACAPVATPSDAVDPGTPQVAAAPTAEAPANAPVTSAAASVSASAAPPEADPPWLTRARYRLRVTGVKLCFPPTYEDGFRFVGVEVLFENKTDERLVLTGSQIGGAELEDAEAFRYKAFRFSGEGTFTPKNVCYPDIGGGEAEAGERRRGWFAYFKVPQESQLTKIHLSVYRHKEWTGPAAEAHPDLIVVEVGNIAVEQLSDP